MAEPLRAEVHPPAIPTGPVHLRILRRLAAAFLFRDFRILWLGAFTSTIGTWMQKGAQSWLVTTLRGPFYVGFDAFLGELPILLFSLVGGVVADRYDRRHLLIGSQYVQMTAAFTLAGLVFWDMRLDGEVGQVVQIWHILTLSAVVGFAQAFGGPAYQSLIPSLVPKEHLPNAIALNSIQFNLARIVGPLLAGAALAAWGMAACFGLNGLSFLVVIAALMSLRVKHVPPTIRSGLLREMKGGLAFVRHDGSLMALSVLGFLTTFLGLPLLTFLPVFVQTVYQEDFGQYTRLLACSGAGAVLGALVVAWFGKFKHMGVTLLLVQMLFGALVVAFSASRALWLSYTLLFFAGASLIIAFALMMSLVQLGAPNEMRGRVMSIYNVAFRGGMPLGSLASGVLMTLASAPVVLSINGLLLAVVAASFLIRSADIRRL